MAGLLWTHATGQEQKSDEIRDIMVVPPPPDWGEIVLLSALALGVGVFIIQRLIRLFRNNLRQKTGQLSAEAYARRRLLEIETRLDELSPNKASLEISETVKDFLASQFKDPIRYETAEEYLGRLLIERPDGPTLSASLSDLVKTFVTISQELKFAKLSHGKETIPELLSQAEQIIASASAAPIKASAPPS